MPDKHPDATPTVRKLTPTDLGALADQLVAATDAHQAAEMTEKLVAGFYGRRSARGQLKPAADDCKVDPANAETMSGPRTEEGVVIEAALRAAGRNARHEARQHGKRVVVSEAGAVVKKDPWEKLLSAELQGALQAWGTRISLARVERGLSATWLASQLDTPGAIVERLESGDPGVSVGYYIAAAVVLGIPTAF